MSNASTEFKKTKIGIFPKDWEVNKLIKLLDDKKELIVGGPFGSNLMVKDYTESGIPIIRLQNIEYFRFINRDIKYITTQKAEELKYHSFQKGDIILAKLGDPVGKTCIVPDYLEEGIVTADVVRIRPLNNEISNQYLMYVLNSYFVWKQLTRDVIGSTRPRVNLNHVRNLLIPLPSLFEQQKIAFILLNLDEIIDQTTYIINQLRYLKKGLMQRLFTKGIGHTEFKETRLGKIPKEWGIDKLKNLVQEQDGLKRGPWGGSVKKAYFVSSGYKIYEQKCVISNDFSLGNYYIDEKKFQELKQFEIKAGDLLMTAAGTLGVLAIVPEGIKPGIYNQAIIRFRLNENIIIKLFFKYFLESDYLFKLIRRFTYGSAIKNFASIKILSLVKFPLPPLKEQNEIVKILQNIDLRIEKEQNYFDNLRNIKKGLMQDLLTGKKRVKIN